MTNLNLSTPWVTFYREIEALLGGDPDINVVWDEENKRVKLYVEDADKAEALDTLLPREKTFGNVTVKVSVLPANEEEESKASLFRRAFEGNPAFAFEKTVETALTNPVSYVVFKKEVVQFWNDDLSDVNGNCSTLYEEIARDVFDDNAGIFFCTDTE